MSGAQICPLKPGATVKAQSGAFAKTGAACVHVFKSLDVKLVIPGPVQNR